MARAVASQRAEILRCLALLGPLLISVSKAADGAYPANAAQQLRAIAGAVLAAAERLGG